MDLLTCYKYFEFLNEECNRCLKSKDLREEELENLKMELDRFKQQVFSSDLPQELLDKSVA